MSENKPEPGRNAPPECMCPKDQPWRDLCIYVYNQDCPVHNEQVEAARTRVTVTPESEELDESNV